MGRSGRLVARVAPVASLDAPTREAMWSLFAAHYDGATRATYERDLADKRAVILARDAGDGSVQGFSTITWDLHRHEGRAFVAIFSGDTIVAPAYWGQKALQNAFGRAITRVKLRHPFTPVYWFLVSKGYKTYLLLTRNFVEHWPRHDRATPPWQQGALDALAQARFGAAWDAARGVVRAPGKDRLKPGIAPLAQELLTRADVRFFHERNPGHADGEELACLGRVGLDSWARYLGKQLRRGRARDATREPWATS